MVAVPAIPIVPVLSRPVLEIAIPVSKPGSELAKAKRRRVLFCGAGGGAGGTAVRTCCRRALIWSRSDGTPLLSFADAIGAETSRRVTMLMMNAGDFRILNMGFSLLRA